jgi:hypothetical protein
MALVCLPHFGGRVWRCAWIAVVVASASLLHAAPFGASGGGGPSHATSYNLAGTGWVVDDGSFPASIGLQSVAYDPTAGPWHKVLAGIDGGDFAASDTGTSGLAVFSISEYLTIGGTTPWTDWHESIMQSGWRWLDDRASSGEPTFTKTTGEAVPGLSIAFTDPTTTEGGKIDFSFDPLPPGTNLKIVKRIIFDGLDPLLPGETFLGKLDVFQYPTVPEPPVCLLAVEFLFAACGFLRCRG